MTFYCTGANQWTVELSDGTKIEGFKDFASVMRYVFDNKPKEITLEDLL